MAAFSSPLLLPLGVSRRLFPRFPVSMGRCVIFDSQRHRA